MPEWLEDGAKFGESGHELELDRCLVKTIHVRWRMLATFNTLKAVQASGRHLIVPELLQRIRECLDLEASLRAWTMSPPPEYRFDVVGVEKLPASSTSEDLFYSSTAHVYRDYCSAFTWNRCRGARLVVNGLINKATGWAQMITHSNEQADVSTLLGHVESKQTILQLVDDICASVPYQFGATEANFVSGQYSETTATQIYPLVWPLMFCSGALYVPESQRAWTREKLNQIGQITGSSLLIAVAKVRCPADEADYH